MKMHRVDVLFHMFPIGRRKSLPSDVSLYRYCSTVQIQVDRRREYFKMPILFRINPDDYDGIINLLLTVPVFILACCLVFWSGELKDIQLSVFKIQMPDFRKDHRSLYASVPLEDCLCSATLTEPCWSKKELKWYRLTTLIVFVSEVYFIWNNLLLSGNHIKTFVRIYWITALLLFFGLLFIVHRSNYYDISNFLWLISYTQFCLFMRDLIRTNPA